LACIAFLSIAPIAIGGDLDPPLQEMGERTDANKTISIRLPASWKDLGPGPVFRSLGQWAGSFRTPPEELPDAVIDVRLASTWSRAELAWWASSPPWNGVRDEASVRRGSHWVEELRTDSRSHRVHLYRVVESGGRTFVIDVQASIRRWPQIENHVRSVLDTFRAIAKPPLAPPPEGYVLSAQNGMELWTDTEDKKTLQRVVTARAAAWRCMTQLLPGEPAIADAPTLFVCDSDGAYEGITLPTKERFAAGCDLITDRRLLIARVKGASSATFDASLQRFAAQQYLQYYFGGPPPDWINEGLPLFAVYSIAKAKLERPSPDFVNSVKAAVASSKDPIDVLVVARRYWLHDDARRAFDLTAYAWHAFFRIGPGAKEYGMSYKIYLDRVRETGSPQVAAKAWNTVDMTTMSAAFRAWVAVWRP
jgi:hypothetical protein